MKKQITTAAYARFSREDETYGIQSQLRAIHEYATTNGLTIDEKHVYTEDNISGVIWPLERPAMSQLYKAIESKKINAVIAVDASRIGRKAAIAETFLDDCFENGIQLHLTAWERPIKDTAKDRGDYLQEAVYATAERLKIKERTMRGRREKALSGAFVGPGGAPYGYALVGRGKNMRLVFDESQSATVKLIDHMYLYEGKGVTEITDYLNANRDIHKSPDFLRGWVKASAWTIGKVGRILSREVYTGVFSYGDIKTSHPELAIRTPEEHAAIQQRLKQRDTGAKRDVATKYVGLFNRRFGCICGYSRVVCSGGKGDLYYRCKAVVLHGRNACKIPKYLPVNRVDSKVWDAIETLLLNPELELQRLREAQQKQLEDHNSAAMTLESLERLRSKHQRAIDRLSQAFAAGAMSVDEFKRARNPLDLELQASEELYKEYQTQVEQKILSDREIDRIVKECRTIADLLNEIGELQFEHKRRVIELLNVGIRLELDDDMIIAYVSIYTKEFTKVSLSEGITGLQGFR